MALKIKASGIDNRIGPSTIRTCFGLVFGNESVWVCPFRVELDLPREYAAEA